MQTLIFFAAAIVLVSCSAPTTSKPGYAKPKGYSGSSGYGNSGYGSYPGSYNPRPHGSYGSGYGRGSSHGYSGYSGKSGYGYGSSYHHGSYRSADGPLDEIDKLYEKVADILAQLKFLGEQVEALSAALSVQEKKVHDLISIIFVELQEVDIRQNASIIKLQEHLYSLNADCKALDIHLYRLENITYSNGYLLIAVNHAWTFAQYTDIEQDGKINRLHQLVKDLKPKLFQVKENEYRCFRNRVSRDTTRLTSIRTRKNRRMCEVGQVTLKADDRRVEYQYQTWFDHVPQFIFGISGFHFDLDALEDPHKYGYGQYYKEPEAIGVILHAYSTKTGFIVEGWDLSFGDTQGRTVDVSFQACTIGPGTDPIDH